MKMDHSPFLQYIAFKIVNYNFSVNSIKFPRVTHTYNGMFSLLVHIILNPCVLTMTHKCVSKTITATCRVKYYSFYVKSYTYNFIFL